MNRDDSLRIKAMIGRLEIQMAYLQLERIHQDGWVLRPRRGGGIEAVPFRVPPPCRRVAIVGTLAEQALRMATGKNIDVPPVLPQDGLRARDWLRGACVNGAWFPVVEA